MTGAFDPDAFDPEAFDTGSQQPPPDHGGHHWPRRPTLRVTVEPKDDEEAALLVALIRHRFRI